MGVTPKVIGIIDQLLLFTAWPPNSVGVPSVHNLRWRLIAGMDGKVGRDKAIYLAILKPESQYTDPDLSMNSGTINHRFPKYVRSVTNVVCFSGWVVPHKSMHTYSLHR